MNFKTTLILLVLLAGAGIAVWFTKDTATDTPTEKAKKLLDINGGDVQTVTITPADGKKIVAVREGTAWKLTSPTAAPADAGRLNALVADLVALESQSQVDVSDGSGLKTPRFVVDLALKDGKTHTITVGDRSGVGDRLYVQLKGNAKADMVATGIDEQLEKPFDELRDKKLVSLSSNEVNYIAIDRPAGKLELTKSAGVWQVTSPEKFNADPAAVSDMLFAATGLQATEFVAGEATSPMYGLGADAKKVTLATASPATTQPTSVTITFGRPDSVMQQNVFAAVGASGSVVKVAKASTAFLDRKPMELRDKKVADFDPATVNGLTVAIESPATTQPTTKPAESKRYAVKRRPAPATQPSTQPAPTTWTTADGQDAGDSAITAILTNLHPLHAEKFVETAPAVGKTITVTIDAAGPVVQVPAPGTIKFIVPAEGSPVGVYNGLTFEVDQSLIEKLEADITKPGPAPLPTTPMPEMGLPMGPMDHDHQ